MKDRLSSLSKQGAGKAADLIRSTLKSNPAETKFTFGGAAAGLAAGLIVGGGIGVAGFFGAVGIPIAAVGLIGGGIVGNRIGIARDKRELDELLRKRDEILAALLADRSKERIKSITTSEEHRSVLFEALETASDTLVILSGWATSLVVDAEFQKKLAVCLNRGVNIYIGYGFKAAHEPRPKQDYEAKAAENLSALCEWCAEQETEGLLIVRYYPNHTKLLICDEKFAVNGSFNWLSNSDASINEERSWIVYDEHFISTELDIVIDGLMSPLKSTKRDLLKKIFPWSDR